MRKLKIFAHISLDGVMRHMKDENGFRRGNWTAPYRSAGGREALTAAQGEEGTAARGLELASSKALSTGIVINSYRATGPLQYQQR